MYNKRVAVFLVCLMVVLTVGASACNRKGAQEVDTESIIVRKEILSQNQYYFHVEYELEGFDAPLEASIKVVKDVYDDYEVGDSYVFSRPVNTP